MSSFAGAARGTIIGVWSASVCHAPLSIAPGPDASISGGGFRVNGVAGWKYVSISDTFDTGTIHAGRETRVVLDGVGSCTQVFGLSIGKMDTSISFTATLVHYGAFFAGSCHVASATLNGIGQIRY